MGPYDLTGDEPDPYHLTKYQPDPYDLTKYQPDPYDRTRFNLPKRPRILELRDYSSDKEEEEVAKKKGDKRKYKIIRWR